MQSAKLVAFVPCHDAEPPHSLKGTWLVSSGMGQLDDDGTIVGKLLSDGHVRGKRFRVEWTSLESLSPRDWEREFAKQFARFYEDFQIGAEDGKLWHAIVALGCTKSDSGPTDSPSVMPMPVEFGPRAVGVFGASHVDGAAAPPTALTERLTRWTADDYPMPLARWVRLGRGQVSWGIVSHCSSTARAVAPYPALVERSVPFNKLQFDVSVALASLLVYRDAMARDPLRLTPFKNAMHNLRASSARASGRASTGRGTASSGGRRLAWRAASSCCCPSSTCARRSPTTPSAPSSTGPDPARWRAASSRSAQRTWCR